MQLSLSKKSANRANSIGLLAIGSELLDGRVLDTNTHWLSQSLQLQSLQVLQKLVCDDSVQSIKSALAYLIEQGASAIIICGGLGPTSDDLTRVAVAEFLGVALEIDTQVVTQLKELFEKRGRPFSVNNERQAYRPVSSALIPNPSGTAPGFCCHYLNSKHNCFIYALPGISSELQLMYKATVETHLVNNLKPVKQSELVYRIFGLTESGLSERIESLQLGADLKIAYSVSFPIINLIVRAHSESKLSALENQLTKAIGNEYIFARSLDSSLAQAVITELRDQKLTLATAESCTGGLIGDMLTEVAGSSQVYKGGIISYSNQVKTDCLAVEQEVIQEFGAVSAETVEAMARGARVKLKTDLAIAVSGVAGPDGGSAAKPVGTVYIGLAGSSAVRVERFNFNYDRNRIRRISAYTALNILRLHSQHVKI